MKFLLSLILILSAVPAMGQTPQQVQDALSRIMAEKSSSGSMAARSYPTPPSYRPRSLTPAEKEARNRRIERLQDEQERKIRAAYDWQQRMAENYARTRTLQRNPEYARREANKWEVRRLMGEEWWAQYGDFQTTRPPLVTYLPLRKR